ncbi:arylsulfatase [Sphingobium xanthum]|nr:arylsulfatase [Sphingobium sp. B10D3B]MCW2402240.1 arylsulfatase [Sphingobium sp. B10D7B]MCW2409219.1 arylsulfatase [Sphingobium xanthum]
MIMSRLISTSCLTFICASSAALAQAQPAGAGQAEVRSAPAQTAGAILPAPEQRFEGKIGRTLAQSDAPKYAPLPKPPAGAPNVLVIITDDVGFGATTPFGGPVPTPTFEALAHDGLRYNRFHTTALCAPTRASLLTGRNPHRVGFGAITEMGTGYPGYTTILPKSAATVGEVLRQHGYGTAWFGKNHNTPEWEQSAAGPFDRWPNGLGFDYFYGFMGGATSLWNPSLFENQLPLARGNFPPGYHLERDMADHAIEWIRMQGISAPGRPFFMLYAPGTSHSPHHAPADWIARFKGQFDRGWDKMREQILARQIAAGVVPAGTKLTPRPASIPAWDTLGPDERRLYARMMETYAGALSYADHQIGRVIETLRASGQLENTLVIYIQGDNGGSGEGGLNGSTNDIAAINGMRPDLTTMLGQIDKLGGPELYNNYPVGWAWAMNAPFQWTKQVASHLGGTRNGLVVSWPARIKAHGEVRTQFHHVADIVPTIYEAVGIAPPEQVDGVTQMPLDGISMAYSFGQADAPGRRHEQIFELQGNAGLYRDGWFLSSTPTRAPWDFAGPGGLPTDNGWELYNLSEDFSQSRNLAAKEPERLKSMIDQFWADAKSGDILPLDNRSFARWSSRNRPTLLAGETRFTYQPTTRPITGPGFPDLAGRSWRAEADIALAKGIRAEGTLVMNGSRYGGWSLYMIGGRPTFLYKASDSPGDILRLQGPALPAGKHRISVAVTDNGQGKPGDAVLHVDGVAVGQGQIKRTIPAIIRGGGAIGRSFDTLDGSFTAPFAFNGQLDNVTIDLVPE